LRLETHILAIIEFGAEATFLARTEKLPLLLSLRRQAEVAKRLVRICGELKIIKPAKYIELSADLQQISKMTNGWIKFLS